jgi:hypothetical protein
MSRIVDDAEFARWIVESVATMDDTSSVTFFDTESTIGSRQQTNKRVSNSVLNLYYVSLFYIPFAGVVTETVAVGSLLAGDGELDAAILHSL